VHYQEELPKQRSTAVQPTGVMSNFIDPRMGFIIEVSDQAQLLSRYPINYDG